VSSEGPAPPDPVSPFGTFVQHGVQLRESWSRHRSAHAPEADRPRKGARVRAHTFSLLLHPVFKFTFALVHARCGVCKVFRPHDATDADELARALHVDVQDALHQLAQRLNRLLLQSLIPQSVKPQATLTDADYQELVEFAFQQGNLAQSARDIILQIVNLDRRSVKDAARDAKAGRVDLIDEGLAAALGAGLEFEDEQAHLVVDIGGGTTNIAILASGGVVSSVSVPAAGNSMDEAIQDYLRMRYAVQLGERTAERVKRELGLASRTEPGDRTEMEMEVVGKQLANGMALPITINSREVRGAIEPVLAEIIAAVRRVIEDSKPEVTADIYYSGVTLTGGGALLTGMAERLQSDLNLRVSVPDDPLTTVALGAGRLLGDPERLQRAALRLDVPAWEDAEKLVVNW